MKTLFSHQVPLQKKLSKPPNYPTTKNVEMHLPSSSKKEGGERNYGKVKYFTAQNLCLDNMKLFEDCNLQPAIGLHRKKPNTSSNNGVLKNSGYGLVCES